MRLTKIKLAGFKSFVDPTTFHLPSNLVGIVGPNGCGKSNVIDAVRWVMGESSARYLRGESMADVIFNGSSSRKPVGQASIELVFDNNQGRLSGPWSQYTEISVQRLLNRNGQSGYFLNGIRCRRRDVTDIFLGTGLGARSYAIIEQGMISRLVEARPEELRVFFEEAAGISKYKERRRETELRIRHTRENLARLDDLRSELAKQLEHLQRQAKLAERYRQYKATERHLKGEMLALRWRALEQEAVARKQTVGDQETALQAVVAQQRNNEAQLEVARSQHNHLTVLCTQAQQRFYELNGEISRLQQYLSHQRQLQTRQKDDLNQIEQAFVTLSEQMHADKIQLETLQKALQAAEPALETANAEQKRVETLVAETETHLHQWQERWEAFNQRASEPQRQAEVERMRCQQLEQQSLQHQRRLQKIQLEQDNLQIDQVDQALNQCREQETATLASLQQAQEQLADLASRRIELQEVQRQCVETLHDIQGRLQTGHGRLASLQALQEAALGKYKETVNGWLSSQGLDDAPRLIECLSVEPGWERAAETVLGDHLEGVCVENLETFGKSLATLQEGSLTLINAVVDRIAATAHDSLANKVQAPWSLNSLLGHTRTASDLDEALRRHDELSDQESWVTPDGVWLGKNWLRIARGADDKSGVLEREREIKQLKNALEIDAQKETQHTVTLEEVRNELNVLQDEHHGLQSAVNRYHREQAELRGRLPSLEERRQQVLLRLQSIAEERQDLMGQKDTENQLLRTSRLALEKALLAMNQLSHEREALTTERTVFNNAVQTARHKANAVRQHAQQQALNIASLKTSLDAAQQSLERMKAQQTQLTDRRKQLSLDLESSAKPLVETQQQLDELLHARVTAETALNESRQAVQAIDLEIGQLDQSRVSLEKQAQALRQTLEQQRLANSEISVRQQGLQEQLQELDVSLTDLLPSLDPAKTDLQTQQELERLGQRIQRLGAVNLAAIDECTQVMERKGYLDTQHDDLMAALTTLENAMRKIDRETRARFKDTFERVNQGVQTLFPRLFGGGEAYLAQTGDDLLETGVTVMARPPGKRVSTIHLLSGGEKALTAVALVFAIFQLNPAPFCMLDEVDAPLDDANVGRFGDLLREMAKQIQFIFITHNKSTMEIAHHLSGVTMHEPGVSRLVAVDVDEAVRLAAS